ncbi:pre-rRNA-processing protein TSR2 homolog isoform X2 [Belonocnema kinseyi]|uniref:pre-rRNA-processing protein TSR2 homolog isoform X2 n=1 Tax=Belonocnema kinseyi TaxID=2817044 RepID=UPI00143DF5AB|nr:pre-rRNA-processing protein TSR2 homolog isoform X2 [Belonocnema kinseyi]
MTNSKDFFLSVTERIFSNWTALKIAVEHGMGSKEKAQAFCPYVTELIYMNAELEDYMDLEFDTELEDASSTQVAEELLRFYRYCAAGDETTALAELEKLPPLQPWIATQVYTMSVPSQSCTQENDSSSEDGEASNNQMEVVDQDWTTVRTKRKK